MKDVKWMLFLGISLLAASAAIYLFEIIVFKRPDETLFYLFQDMAFLPVNALLVVIILETLLKWHARQSLLKKMNIAIGIFFSEVGIKLLDIFAAFDNTRPEVGKLLRVRNDWADADYSAAKKRIMNFDFDIDSQRGNLRELHEFFNTKRASVLALMENQNLLEHESFTDMLFAVSHLLEELAARKDLASLSLEDSRHISSDMKRAYSALVAEWLGYMNHLRKEYPYLYSLAVRTNPFDPEARPEIG